MKKRINKYYILYLILILCCLILLPQCFAKEKQVFFATGSDIAEITSPVEGTAYTYYYSENIVLTPGIYQVRVHDANLTQDAGMDIEVICQNSSFKALRGNSVTMYAGQKNLDFEVYVLDTIDTAQLSCILNNADYDAIGDFSIWKTNLGARVLLCILLFMGLVIHLLMYFRDRISSGKVTLSRQVVVYTLAVCILIAYIPYLNDYFTLGADSGFHLLRIEGLKETLLHANQFPVRVQDYWLFDHGYMVSTFYSDFFLMIPALLRIIGFPLGFVAKLLVLAILILHATIAFHCFHKCTDNDYAALMGSICTLLAPYHFHNIYNRGALGEYTAMAFFPLLIAGMFLLYTKDTASKDYKKYKWYLIAGLSFILQCHLITCEISVFMILAFCLIFWKKTFRKETFLQLLWAAVITLLLNCFFYLPMLYMMVSDNFFFNSLTQDAIQSHGTNLSHFLQLVTNKGGAQTGMFNAEALQPGAGLILALIVFALWGYQSKKDANKKYTVHTFVWIVVLLVLSTKYFPWDAMKANPLLNFISTAIQFPYRLLSPIIMLGGLFVALFFLWSKNNFSGWLFKGCMALVILFTVIPALYQVSDIAFHTRAAHIYSSENIGTKYVVNGEYLLTGSSIEDYHYHEPVADEHITYSDYEKNGSTIQMYVSNGSSETEYIEVPLIGYKGYVVSEPLSIAEERGCNNDLRIAVPGNYSGTITISYKEPILFRAAEWISLISATFLIGYKMLLALKRRKTVC